MVETLLAQLIKYHNIEEHLKLQDGDFNRILIIWWLFARIMQPFRKYFRVHDASMQYFICGWKCYIYAQLQDRVQGCDNFELR